MRRIGVFRPFSATSLVGAAKAPLLVFAQVAGKGGVAVGRRDGVINFLQVGAARGAAQYPLAVP